MKLFFEKKIKCVIIIVVIIMTLLNKKVYNSQEFKELQLILKNLYIKNSNNPVSYNELNDAIVSFVTKIMFSYLEDTEFRSDSFSCIIKKLPSSLKGTFDDENNLITINEEVVNDIYNGDIVSISTIFHELEHFKTKYDIKLGRITINLIRCIKEQLLREKSLEPFKIVGYVDNYYKCNYEVFSDEKMAEINAATDLCFFILKTGIEISKQQLQELKDIHELNTIQHQNYLRDLRLNIHFNNNFLDFEEAFDIMIKSNPEWLKFSQLNIEYYIDENGKVRKRTKEELEKRLKMETDEDIKEYIQYLLKSDFNKLLIKSEFPLDDKKLKDDEMKYTTIINKNSTFKR